MKLIWKYAEECQISVAAYCLMDNHVHFLLEAEMQDISSFMQHVGTTYGVYFNHKYDRVGHLFQNRYDSFPVDTENYYLCCIRYIHKNPQKAGICQMEKYPWSSYSNYRNRQGPVSWERAWKLLGEEQNFRDFMQQEDTEKYPFLATEDKHYTDDEAEKIARVLLQSENTAASEAIADLKNVKNYVPEIRNRLLGLMYEKGISVKQIEKITGISQTVIRRGIREKNS